MPALDPSRPTASSLEELGWSARFAASMPEGVGLLPARVASVYAARVEVWMPEGPRLAKLRARAMRDEAAVGGIAVGDWVAVTALGDDEVVVERVLPRRTAFVRQAAGERAEPQAIAANVDRVFVVTSLEGDLNLRRLDRYLVAIRASGAEAVIVLSKVDVAPAGEADLEALSVLAPVVVTSARTGQGVDDLRALVPAGTTGALVGSSGVGKSALLNGLLGETAQREGEVRAHDRRGRHTTTRRALFVVPGGGLLVDTPGMRELKPWQPGASSADDEAFDDVAALAAACRYRDCRHAGEPGCAVRAAVASGALDAARLASWETLERERAAHRDRQDAFARVQRDRRARAFTTAMRRGPKAR